MAKEPWERIAKEQYGLWRNNPVTMAFFSFCSDYAEALEAEVLRRWKSKELTLDLEKEAAGRIDAIHEVVEVDYYTITSFYGLDEPKEEIDAA